MKAALIHSFGGIEKIKIEEIPIPIPQEGEVQIAVKCAGINPVDWKIADGLLQSRMEYQFPITLGWDVSGEISSVGKGVHHLKVGDPVFAYCRKKSLHDGSFAEYICLAGENVVKKPKTLSFAEAAAIPLSALTAWQSLYDTAHFKEHESVLIHAGAGGVGGFAIQFAKLTGAHVITTASRANFDYVKQLGADEVIDYTQENFVDAIHKKHSKGVDVIFDTVGGASLKASYLAAKKGGRLVTIAGVVDEALATSQNVTASYVFVHPDGKELTAIAELLDQKKILSPRVTELPFAEVTSALRTSREGHIQGKLILKIS